MELTGIFPILRRWIGVIIMAAVFAAGAGFAIGASSTPTYESEVVMLVGPLASDQNTQQAAGQQALTYAELVLSSPVKTEAAELARVSRGATRAVRANANQTTRFITIKARNADPDAAANLANAFAEVMIRRTAATPTNPARPEGQLVVVDAAAVPSDPVAPRLELIVPLSAMAGLLGALMLVLLIEYLSDTAKSPEEVAEAAGVPCLTTIKGRSGQLLLKSPSRRARDEYRLLATQIDLAAKDLRCVLVLGVDEGDGAGTVATNLATVYADRREPVTLVDAGAQEVTRLANLYDEPGLSEVLRNPDSPSSMTSWLAQLPFGVMPIGQGGRLEAVRREDALRVVQDLAAVDGLVVVHSVSPTNSPAALVWARVADVTVLCVRRQHTRRDSVTRSVEHLRTVGANLLGAVLHETGPAGPLPVDDLRTPAAPAPEHSSNGSGSTDPVEAWSQVGGDAQERDAAGTQT